jgi:hypothetical protein
MARRGDTKPLCQVAHASVVFIGVSLLPISDRKSLVLCQHGSQGTPRACSSRRRRGDPLYLDRAVTTGPHTRGRSLSWGVWTWSAQPRHHHPAAQERRPQCGTACHGVRHARRPCTFCTSPRWALPMTTTLRPAPLWTGRRACPSAAPCSTWHSGQEWCEAYPSCPPPACARHGLPQERRYGIRG